MVPSSGIGPHGRGEKCVHRLRDSRARHRYITIPLCSVRREKSPNAGNYNVARCSVVKVKTRCPFLLDSYGLLSLFSLFLRVGALCSSRRELGDRFFFSHLHFTCILLNSDSVFIVRGRFNCFPNCSNSISRRWFSSQLILVVTCQT